MSRRSFILSLSLSVCLAFVGCKSDPEPAPASTTPAATACPKCGPDKACACPPAEGGTATPPPANGG